MFAQNNIERWRPYYTTPAPPASPYFSPTVFSPPFILRVLLPFFPANQGTIFAKYVSAKKGGPHSVFAFITYIFLSYAPR